jgi:hypothetical protein
MLCSRVRRRRRRMQVEQPCTAHYCTALLHCTHLRFPSSSASLSTISPRRFTLRISLTGPSAPRRKSPSSLRKSSSRPYRSSTKSNFITAGREGWCHCIGHKHIEQSRAEQSSTGRSMFKSSRYWHMRRARNLPCVM